MLYIELMNHRKFWGTDFSVFVCCLNGWLNGCGCIMNNAQINFNRRCPRIYTENVEFRNKHGIYCWLRVRTKILTIFPGLFKDQIEFSRTTNQGCNFTDSIKMHIPSPS